MVLVDTSVLIDFSRGIDNPSAAKFEEMQNKGIPFGINNFIYQEILQGAKTRKEFDLLKKYLSSQKFYDLKEGQKSYEAAAEIYFTCRRQGVIIRSTIDLLIAQTAIENELFLLHNDKDFSDIAGIEKRLKEY